MNARLLPLLFCSLLAACGSERQDGSKVAVPDRPGVTKTSAQDRALRRAYDGAPPVIPHHDIKADCLACHRDGMAVPDIGYAPPVPHAGVEKPGAMSRCPQCHVFQKTDEVFVASVFTGLKQDLRAGKRLNDLAPPVIPHQTLLRENCITCHSGPAAREEIRCSHPERSRCPQCHAEQKTFGEFTR